MARVTARIRGTLGAALALLSPFAATAAADVPPGPRLAYLRSTARPATLTVTIGNAVLRETTRVAGGAVRVRPLPFPYSGPAWSPDGSLLAFSGMSGGLPRLLSPDSRRIYVVAADGSGLHAIPGTRRGFGPVFAPDGESIAFAKTVNHRLAPHGAFGAGRWKATSTWSVRLDGSGLKRLTPLSNGVEDLPSSFSPDGSLLALTHRDVFHDRADALALRLHGGGTRLLARSAAWPRYSPDGARIAFLGIRRIGDTSCCELGDGFSVDLYAMNADGSSRRQLTDTPAKAEQPASWDPSGERLAYTTKSAPTESSSGDLEASVMQINADGTCPSRISVPVIKPGGYRLDFYFPTWQPGPGHEAGRIAC